MTIQKPTLINRIHTHIQFLFNKIQYPILERIYRNSISIIAYANRICNYTVRNNLGDDLNFNFIEALLDVKCIKYEFSFLAKNKHKYPTYSFIGSILEYVIQTNPHTIVWGTGFKFSENTFNYEDLKHLDIRAVRGPRTRNLLLSKGINCPIVYGDPALLLSCYYTPIVKRKRYRIGIVPHKDDASNPLLLHLLQDDSVAILNLRKYKNWRSFIDNLCACDFIISTSLHGLIIADSYSIPNMWISVSDRIEGGDFKYLDYYEGVCKTPIKKHLYDGITIDEILTWKSLWIKPTISTSFINACPIKLKKTMFCND